MPCQHPPSAAKPGNARRRAHPISRRQEVAGHLASRRPRPWRSRVCRRHPSRCEEVWGADRPGEAWTFIPGARRTDTGHFAIQAEVASFTQGFSYDVLVVADEEAEFGDQLLYRTFDPRLVAGTQGLVPSAWARPHEQWGATQLQERFLHQAKRWMTERDYAAWMAVRAIGEAATRSKSTDPAAISAFLRSDH